MPSFWAPARSADGPISSSDAMDSAVPMRMGMGALQF